MYLIDIDGWLYTSEKDNTFDAASEALRAQVEKDLELEFIDNNEKEYLLALIGTSETVWDLWQFIDFNITNLNEAIKL